ncbi:MAG: acyltransferase [Lachnospiraceae bacterium]|nr:acyltransferase [Lachnospiraceae bacterium]
MTDNQVSTIKTTTSARDASLDQVRGVAIFLVMLGHCIVLNGLDEQDPYIYDVIKSVQMPLFMLISGVVAALSGLSLRKLQKRAAAYLLPFFSWFVVAYFLARIREKLQHVPVQLSIGGFLGELKDLLFQTDRGLWFFMTLFVITVLMTLAYEIATVVTGMATKKTSEKAAKNIAGNEGYKSEAAVVVLTILVSIVLYLLVFLQARSGNTLLSPSLTLLYMPYYVMGYGMHKIWNVLRDKTPGKTLAKVEPAFLTILLMAFLALVILCPLSVPASSAKELLLQLLASVTGTVSLFGLLRRLFRWLGSGHDNRRVVAFLMKALTAMGQATVEIYVLHFRFARILRLSERGLVLYSPEGFAAILLNLMLMGLLTEIFILLIRKIPPLAFLLFGKKSGGRPKEPASQE